MLRTISTALELAGLVSITAAAFVVALPLGLAIGGIAALLLGLMLDPPNRSPQ